LAPHRDHGGGKGPEWDQGQTGDQTQNAQEPSRDEQRVRLIEQLPPEFGGKIAFRTGAGNDDAGGRGDKECRNLSEKSVPNREKRVLGRGFRDGEAALCHADDESAEDVDRGDDEARNRVAAYELA